MDSLGIRMTLTNLSMMLESLRKNKSAMMLASLPNLFTLERKEHPYEYTYKSMTFWPSIETNGGWEQRNNKQEGWHLISIFNMQLQLLWAFEAFILYHSWSKWRNRSLKTVSSFVNDIEARTSKNRWTNVQPGGASGIWAFWLHIWTHDLSVWRWMLYPYTLKNWANSGDSPTVSITARIIVLCRDGGSDRLNGSYRKDFIIIRGESLNLGIQIWGSKTQTQAIAFMTQYSVISMFSYNGASALSLQYSINENDTLCN